MTERHPAQREASPHRVAPEGAKAAGPTHQELAACIRELLDCYWDEGDGYPPPAFIKRADLLARYYGK